MQQIIFILLLIVVGYLANRFYGRIIKNIKLGKDDDYSLDKGQSLRNMVLIAFGQKKMFKRWIPAIFHLFIYVAFILTQIELIEIIIDGVSGQHRIFANALGAFYTLIICTIEILSFLALIATFVFLSRRNLLKIPRFVKSEMDGWPRLDANLILIGELLLVAGIFTMNGADQVLQSIDPEHYPSTGVLPISALLASNLFEGMGTGTLMFLERAGWWLHILVVFGFLLYLPFSKHLHILFAFPNTYFAKQNPRGEMENMPAIMNEVKSMFGLAPEGATDNMEELPTFGANDVTQLSWKNLLDAYTCTECGRCTDECPANQTGKKLSPRKIMMDVRDRATEIGANIQKNNIDCIDPSSDQKEILSKDNYADGKSLFDYVSKEEIHACTSCNACVEACPVMINPLDIIFQMRRYEILTESSGPADWTPMFTSLENQGSVWQVPDARDAWKNEN
jgi:heterodisulfide reductase subunit C